MTYDGINILSAYMCWWCQSRQIDWIYDTTGEVSPRTVVTFFYNDCNADKQSANIVRVDDIRSIFVMQ